MAHFAVSARQAAYPSRRNYSRRSISLPRIGCQETSGRPLRTQRLCRDYHNITLYFLPFPNLNKGSPRLPLESDTPVMRPHGMAWGRWERCRFNVSTLSFVYLLEVNANKPPSGSFIWFGGVLMLAGSFGEFILGNTFPFVVFGSFGKPSHPLSTHSTRP